MNFSQALELLKQGQHVRLPGWPSFINIYLENNIIHFVNCKTSRCLDWPELLSEEWEEVRTSSTPRSRLERILDDEGQAPQEASPEVAPPYIDTVAPGLDLESFSASLAEGLHNPEEVLDLFGIDPSPRRSPPIVPGTTAPPPQTGNPLIYGMDFNAEEFFRRFLKPGDL